MNTNNINKNLNGAPTNLNSSTMQTIANNNKNNIIAASGPSLFHVIPIAASSVNTLQLGVHTTANHVNVPQNATILNKNKIQQTITTIPTTSNIKITKQNNTSSVQHLTNNREIPANIAQIIGTAIPVQNVVATNVPNTGFANKYGAVATMKSVQGLSVVQAAGIAAPAINATNATLIQLPATGGNLQRVIATAAAPATLTNMFNSGTFSVINPNVNSKIQTSQFVINTGTPKPTIIKQNAATISTTLPAKAKIVEIKAMDKEINKQVAATSQSQQLLPASVTPTATAIAATTTSPLLMPKQTTITTTIVEPYKGVRFISSVTSRTATNNAAAQELENTQENNDINLEKLLPETTITKEPITVMSTSNSTTINNGSTKPTITSAATITLNATEEPTNPELKITRINSFNEDLDKSDDALVIDDSSDAEFINNHEENDYVTESNGRNVSDEISQSPHSICHISNSVVLTKADVRTNNSSRNISSEPANVVLMKLPNATQQNAGAKPENLAIPINEALSMTKEHLQSITAQSCELRPILLTRSNSIPEAQRNLSPRAMKRSISLNCGAPAPTAESSSVPAKMSSQTADNDETNEITFIELDDSFDEDYTDDSESSKTTTPKNCNTNNINHNSRNHIEKSVKNSNAMATLDKNDNIKSNGDHRKQEKQQKSNQNERSFQKSHQILTQYMNSVAKNLNEDNDEQIIKSLLCNEQIAAITPSSSSSVSSFQENSPKQMTAQANTAKTSNSRSNSISRPPPQEQQQNQQSTNISPVEQKTAINNKPTKINAATTSSATIGAPNVKSRRLCRDNNIASALSMISTFDMLNWKEDHRIGTARGTSMRFELNEFNLLQLHERNCPPRYRIHAAYERPIYERTFGLTPKPENTDPMLYMCRKCKTYGPAVDFLAPEFCSYTCLRRTGMKRTSQTNTDVVGNFAMKRARKHAATTSSVSSTSDVVAAANTKTNSTPYSSTSTGLQKFRWSTYLAAMRSAYAAPIDLFLNPFPTGPNPFTVGMKLEAIDPENCSLFCVCTVVEIQGYRMRLNFDGYDSIYDFWINADSMDIFPPGWCEKTKRLLQPPRNHHSMRSFVWSDYLKKTNGIPADKKLFTHLNGSSMTNRNPFQIGMFLEADDLNDTGKLCVASVADVLDERIRVHFDGWDDCYDYWVDISSPYIHPCGWHEGRQQLLVPPEYGNTSFNWREYILETNTGCAAPEDFFVPRDPIDFRPGMKLEVVDPRNPSLIRPASVAHRTRHRVKIIFDCWPMDYTFVLEDDSPDLHPIGWCDATGHELEPPPGYQQLKKLMPCTTTGCRGIGNMNRTNGRLHATREACPYAPENWRTKCEKTPRIDGKQIRRHFTPPEKISKNLNEDTTKQQPAVSSMPTQPTKYPTRGRPRKVNRQPTVAPQPETQALEMTQQSLTVDQIKIEKSIDTVEMTVPVPAPISAPPQIKIEAVVSNGISAHKLAAALVLEPHIATMKRYLCDYGPRLQQNYSLWRENISGIDIAKKVHQNPVTWTTSQVYDFLNDVLNDCSTMESLVEDIPTKFLKHDIDGIALLMLQQQDLIDIIDLKLGQALKICAIILQLRILVVTKYESASSNCNDENEAECSVK